MIFLRVLPKIFLWLHYSGDPGARGPRFIEPPEPPVPTPLIIPMNNTEQQHTGLVAHNTSIIQCSGNFTHVVKMTAWSITPRQIHSFGWKQTVHNINNNSNCSSDENAYDCNSRTENEDTERDGKRSPAVWSSYSVMHSIALVMVTVDRVENNTIIRDAFFLRRNSGHKKRRRK